MARGVESSGTSSAAAPRSGAVIVIRPIAGWSLPSLAELWHYRELLFFLAWRDLRVRYAQTFLGSAWTIIQPVTMTFIFVYAFHKLGKIHTGSVPYPVFALSGFVFWTYFSKAVSQGGDSLAVNSALLTKIYCPRLLIPIGVIVAAIADIVLAVAFFLVFAAFYGYWPTWRLVTLPLFLALGLVFTVGAAALLSAINVRYRDVRQVLPFLVTIGLFLSPIAYPIHSSAIALVNPLVGTIEGWRWALVGTPQPSAFALACSVVGSFVVLLAGVAYFSRVERVFADVV
jgi:lipopolysaccharide transport system permease protein